MNHRLPFLAAVAWTSVFIFCLMPEKNSSLLAQTPAVAEASEDKASEDAKQSADADTKPDVSRELIKKLEHALTETTWTGQFTIEGGDGPPRPESYVIRDVSHEGGNNWVINAQITYGARYFLPCASASALGRTDSSDHFGFCNDSSTGHV